MYFPPIHTMSYNKTVQAFSRKRSESSLLQNKRWFKIVIYVMLLTMLLSSILFTAGLFFKA
ncbi:stressosome-associated protein Prli42 [Paenibacillus sp. Soil787]|uniref:stressosome-associated protein Prli42 n=1 Tax=Paenibacillus sp. Soil787 TaxID=1736411 RepID=UPI002AA2AF45|nr:stressosome-associated protein Prli42 [Paenibacillus sp. Soil787]